MGYLVRKTVVVVVAVVAFAGIVSGPASAARPAIMLVSPSPGEGATLTSNSVSFEFTYNRKPKATQSLVCALSGPTSSSGACDTPVAFGDKGSQSGKSYSGLANGSYTFTVSHTLTEGGTALATRHFTVAVPVTATAIGAGFLHSCAVMSGAVKCWGDNLDGTLGNGTTTNSSVPVDVSGLSSSVTAISAGFLFSCAVMSGGAAKCWGWNFLGRLGNGTATNSSVPVDVSGLSSGVTAIDTGEDHSCALTSGGAVKCWGSNAFGQLGNGTTTNSSVPVDVSGLSSGVTAIAVGAFHSCALTSGGAVKCWGYDIGQYPAQYPDPPPPVISTIPVDVPGLSSGVTAIAAGGINSCALTSGGAAKCWGNNDTGQLGNGTTMLNSSTPVDVSGLSSGVTAIAVGFGHICALTSGGAVKCWGLNFFGDLGDGTTTNSSTPVDVSGLSSGVTAIDAGNNHNCALTSRGDVKCWGYNLLGQLGNGTTTNSSTPVAVVF